MSSIPETKTCADCKIVKPVEDFYDKKLKHNIGKASMCKECQKARSTKWRKNNLNKFNEYQRDYAKKTKKSSSISDEQKERRRERDRKRYWANIEQSRNKARAHYSSNADSANARARKRRAIKNDAATEYYTSESIVKIWGSICYLCNLEIDLEAPRRVGVDGWENGLHLEHVIPLSSGGSDTIENVRPSHGLCNLKKWAN